MDKGRKKRILKTHGRLKRMRCRKVYVRRLRKSWRRKERRQLAQRRKTVEKRIIRHKKKEVKIEWRKKRKVVVNRVTRGPKLLMGRNKTLWRKAVKTLYKKGLIYNSGNWTKGSGKTTTVRTEHLTLK